MHMTARGWNRNMGAWNLIEEPLDKAKISRSPGEHQSVSMNSPSIHITSENGINIGWGKRLTLTGNFMLDIRFTKGEVMHLFRLCIGEIIGNELLNEAGLSIDDAVLRDKIKAMTVDQLLGLLGSQTVSEAEFTRSDLDEELVVSSG